MEDAVRQLVADGETMIAGIGSDIADPDSQESAYDGTPLLPLLSMFDAADELESALTSIRCAALIMTSPEDHVVPPTNSDVLAAAIAGPVERISLDRSYHVATLDYDRELIEKSAVAFADRIVAG
jgi:carboxylesterase